MPFTPSHIVAVLPFARTPLAPAALPFARTPLGQPAPTRLTARSRTASSIIVLAGLLAIIATLLWHRRPVLAYSERITATTLPRISA